MGFIIAMVRARTHTHTHTHTHREPTQHCISVCILLLLSYNLLPAPQSWGFKIPYSQMPQDKEAIPNFSNSTDHLSNRARPNSESKVQCNFLLHSICLLPDLTGRCNVELMDEYKLQMLRTSNRHKNIPFLPILSFFLWT